MTWINTQAQRQRVLSFPEQTGECKPVQQQKFSHVVSETKIKALLNLVVVQV